MPPAENADSRNGASPERAARAGDPPCPFVSRGGIKLAAALDAFALNPAGLVCADLGCNAGGFTDCLLQRNAAHVYAVDTGYGMLDWKLRNDPRVVVMERVNAIHLDPRTAGCGAAAGVKPAIRKALAGFDGCSLVVIDLGWTRQSHAIPAALRWLRADTSAAIVTLIKPHYEAERSQLTKGVLAPSDAEAVMRRVVDSMPSLGVRVEQVIQSPILGGAGKGHEGNVEYLAMVGRA